MDGKIEKEISKALRKSSPKRALSILLVCACALAAALYLRFFVFSVWQSDGKFVLACELELCRKNARSGDLILASAPGGDPLLLLLVGKSGDSVKIPTPFDTIELSIPRKGDTISFADISPALWDASLSLLREQSPEANAKVAISLWNGEKEIPFSFVGRASISGRPVSEREVAFLPWHELKLLELQLQKIFPSIDSIYFKRKVFSDTTEIEKFAAGDELFYLSCEKGGKPKLCYDSRERGFFKKSDLRGRRVLGGGA